jgi:hypothetical protein
MSCKLCSHLRTLVCDMDRGVSSQIKAISRWMANGALVKSSCAVQVLPLWILLSLLYIHAHILPLSALETLGH